MKNINDVLCDPRLFSIIYTHYQISLGKKIDTSNRKCIAITKKNKRCCKRPGGPNGWSLYGTFCTQHLKIYTKHIDKNNVADLSVIYWPHMSKHYK